MYTVEKLVGTTWKKDRSYKIFDNAESRVYALHSAGVNAKVVERK